jgi:hypothetical protein
MTDVDGSAEKDKAVIGVTAKGQEVLTRLLETGWFRTEAAAFQAAAAFALASDLDLPLDGSYGTKWNKGGALGSMLSFLEWYVPTSTPARQIEILAEAGLTAIGERLKPGANLTDVFSLREVSTF